MFKFKAPQDINWGGHWRWGPYLLLPITVCVILLWIFTASALIYARFVDGKDTGVWYYEYSGDDAILYEVFLRISILIVETVHLPIQICLFLRVRPGWRLHPVTALTLVLIMLGGWWFAAMMGLVMDALWLEEYDRTTAWKFLAVVRVILLFTVVMLYHVYMGFACKAVHEWRGRTGRRRSRKGEQKVKLNVGDAEDSATELRRIPSLTPQDIDGDSIKEIDGQSGKELEGVNVLQKV